MADKLRITKVDNVEVLSGGQVSQVTLHLEPHHLVLVQKVLPPPGTPPSDKRPAPAKTRESWIAYPMIAFCTFKPTVPGSGQASSIRIRGRDFRFVQLNFPEDRQARSAYDSIKGATCRLGRIEKLHAFSYKPQPLEKQINGWELYDAKAEWRRQGISEKGVDRGWRISKINTDYAFSPTYPALLAVPSTITDNTLKYAVQYRSKARLPVLTYLHPVNNCAITRSSQPLSGLRGHRSIQDEKLVAACFSASAQGDDEPPSAPISRGSPASSQADLPSHEAELSDTERMEDEIIAAASIGIPSEKPHIYGAQQHNLIVDARPTVNAYAMKAVGLGSEDMAYYPFAAKEYLGIENIHVMRDSLNKVIEAIKDADISPLPPNRELLAKSGWLKHITGLLTGASLIARRIGIEHSHVLIHCSDGWDRTSQLSALGQLLLDPYYRTMDGFIVLVEKDWLAFGHMFQHRSGYLNSEKWFSTEKDALAGSAIQPGGIEEGRGDPVQNVQNILFKTQRFFNRGNQGQDSTPDPDAETSFEESPNGKKPVVLKGSLAEKEATKPKETSPVFHQFLDAVYQLLRQFPTRFEFNERFLRRLLYHLYSCQYGTFLYNNEKSRLDANVQERTTSVWSYFLSRRAEFMNPDYDFELDDHVKGKERLLLPDLTQVRWWHEVFNRTDEEMNGSSYVATERYLGNGSDLLSNNPGFVTPIETAKMSVQVTPPSSTSTFRPRNSDVEPSASRIISNGNDSAFASLRDGIAGLGIGRGKGQGSGSKSPAGSAKQPMELEMQ